MGFWDQYKHPMWQQRRLEILEEAGWACEQCNTEETELHVHHTYYERGKKPWEYPDRAYRVLCVGCHKRRGEIEKEIQRAMAPLCLDDLLPLRDYVLAKAHYVAGDPEKSPGLTSGAADFFRLPSPWRERLGNDADYEAVLRITTALDRRLRREMADQDMAFLAEGRGR